MTSTQRPLPCVGLSIEVFLKYFCSSDNHLKTSQATGNGLKIQVLLHVISVLRKANSSIPPPGKASALEPAAGNAAWAMEGLQKSIHHLQTDMFLQHPKQLLLLSRDALKLCCSCYLQQNAEELYNVIPPLF